MILSSKKVSRGFFVHLNRKGKAQIEFVIAYSSKNHSQVLAAADLVLAFNNHWTVVVAGVSLWGLHMGITQGLLATMVANTAPTELPGTAFGFFNLVSGIAMLLASTVAGLLWDRVGASVTFYTGAIICEYL